MAAESIFLKDNLIWILTVFLWLLHFSSCLTSLWLKFIFFFYKWFQWRIFGSLYKKLCEGLIWSPNIISSGIQLSLGKDTAMAGVDGDKYRSYLSEEELKNTQWNAGPPNYDVVNKLFEEGRTKVCQDLRYPNSLLVLIFVLKFCTHGWQVWQAGSLEEKVQNLVKTWEMELVHKANPDDYKTLDAKKFVLVINGMHVMPPAEFCIQTWFFKCDWVGCSWRIAGKKSFTLEEIAKVGGSYNVFLQSSLPPALRIYNPDEETYESSQTEFKNIFSRGFALEILQVYSGPPVIAYKFRHWGYMEAPFHGHPPTGELIEFFGMAVFEVFDDMHANVFDVCCNS